MNVLTMRTMYAVISLLFFLTMLNGCAQQKFNVVDAEQLNKTEVAKIQSLTVSDDASYLEILTDRDVVHSFYQTVDPPKVVIDLSQTDPGAFTVPMEIAKGNVKRIEVAKRGSLSRIEIYLNKDGKFSLNVDPADKKKLRALFGEAQKPVEVAATLTEEAAKASPGADRQDAKEAGKQAGVIKTEEVKPVQAVGAVVAAEPAPAVPAAAVGKIEEAVPAHDKLDQRVESASPQPEPQSTDASYKKVVSLNVASDGVEFTVVGGVDRTDSFILAKPNRLIVDLFGVKSGMKETAVAIGSFGINKARFSVSADKVRVVFDSSDGTIPPHGIMKTEYGVKVLFGAAATAVAKETSNAATAEKQPTAEAPVLPVVASAGAMAANAPAPAPAAPVTAKPEEVRPQASDAVATAPDAELAKSAAVQQVANETVATSEKVRQGAVTAIKAVDDGIVIVTDGAVDKFNSFRLSSPDRLVIDLFGVKSGMKAQAVAIGAFGVDKARIGASADKVRIVLDAAKDVISRSQVAKTEQGLKIVFSKEAVPAAAPDVQTGQQPVTKESGRKAPVVVTSAEAALESIDFKLVDDYSRIAIKVNGTCSPEKPVKGKNGLTLTIKGCTLPKKLQRMLDTGSFASVVREVTPYAIKRKGVHDTKIFVKLRADAPSTVKHEGDTIYWDIKNTEVPEPRVSVSKKTVPPPRPEVTSRAEDADVLTRLEDIPQIKPATTEHALHTKKIYTGRKVTLEFSDADIRKIFQLIAEVSNLNFLIADDVSGTISIKLVNVPWDQALDVIMESKNLEMKREGTIVQIKPKGRFKSMEQAEAEEKKAKERQMELQTVVFDINYASVGEIAGQLDKLRSQHDNVSVSIDARTNRVIVTDIAPSIEKMRELIKTLDVPEKQVMIEARIVEASATFAQDLGVQWSLSYSDGSASIAGINNLTSAFGGVVATTLPSATSGGMATGMSFGKLASNIQLDLRLSAAATTGIVKIISTPKVVTLNNKAAKISQGQSIPYQTVSAEGTKTEFVEAALTLEVTPHITADGNIGMKIKASNNSPGSAAAGSTPPINKKEATTELQVKNGETTVIGGIYVDNDVESDTGVPFLKDIPLLGWLFKSNSKTKSKSELLIFITPKILS
jgi:type IV pilus assembly protein PilQ